MKKIKHETKLVHEAIVAGVKYAEKSHVWGFQGSFPVGDFQGSRSICTSEYIALYLLHLLPAGTAVIGQDLVSGSVSSQDFQPISAASLKSGAAIVLPL